PQKAQEAQRAFLTLPFVPLVLFVVTSSPLPLIASDDDFAQRGVKRDFISAAIQQALGMRWRVEAILDQALSRPGRRNSGHRKIRKNLLCLKGGALHGGVNCGFEAPRHEDGDITD